MLWKKESWGKCKGSDEKLEVAGNWVENEVGNTILQQIGHRGKAGVEEGRLADNVFLRSDRRDAVAA